MKLMDIQRGEGRKVSLLLMMSFLWGMFLAGISVASQSLFLRNFNETTDLPNAFVLSGLFGLIATIVYNLLQNRIPFPLLGSISLVMITAITALMEFGESLFADPTYLTFIGFTQILPFTFITYLVFWGSFGRLFNLRQSKRLLGVVDAGGKVASLIAFFIIPQLLNSKDFEVSSLYTVSLLSIIGFTLLFIYLSFSQLNKVRSFIQEKQHYKKVEVKAFVTNKYMLYMSLFIIVSIVAVTFVNYSFLNVTTLYFKTDLELASFISYFEMTIVIFGLLFETFAADRIIQEYGMRVAMLISPMLIGIFTLTAAGVGYAFGYSPDNNFFIVFFICIAMSRLFIQSIREAVDSPTFRLYLLPIENEKRIDVQTKTEGMVTAFATLVAGALFILINQIKFFDLFSITLFTLPLAASWFFVANRMHRGYRHTLQDTLTKNKERQERKLDTQYTVNEVLEKGVSSSVEEKVIYALKLMEKMEPSLFENTVIRLSDSKSKKIRLFVEEKIIALGIGKDPAKGDIKRLAEQAFDESGFSDLLSISDDKLLKLSKSVKQGDRILALKLLRKNIDTKTIFILLELLRDADPKVRYEALFTARKVKRSETWPVLIELLGSPSYSHHATSALKEAGESVLNTLETAFHKSGQSETIMLRIVQIMGRIGGTYAMSLLWRKADYPDKRIVKQILYSFRFAGYQAVGRQAIEVQGLLETELSKTIWNLAALNELPDTKQFFFLRDALQEEINENFDQIYMLLSILYDPKSVQLVRENFAAADPDSIAFALELLDLFIDPTLKPKLFPLFDDLPTSEKVQQLQIHFPRENYTPVQVINYILNRDFNFNNRWTKVCAVHATAYMAEFRPSRGLIAQAFNKDRLLQETASWVIYNKDKETYEAISGRLPIRDKKYLDLAIEKNQLLNGLDDGFFLNIEMIMLIKQLPVFKNIHGSLISDLADKIEPLDLNRNEKAFFKQDAHNAPVIIVACGEVRLLLQNESTITLKPGAVYGDLFQDGIVPHVLEAVATERTVIFKINLMDFYFVMANHHELVQGLIKNVGREIKLEI